jgi:hypothetical protein
VSEKLKCMTLNDQVEFMVLENHPPFSRTTLSWFCNLPQQRYNCGDSGPKKEIPVEDKGGDAELMLKLVPGQQIVNLKVLVPSASQTIWLEKKHVICVHFVTQ